MPQWAMPSLTVDTVAGLVERVVLSGESQVRFGECGVCEES